MEKECRHSPMPRKYFNHLPCIEDGHTYPSYISNCQKCGAPMIQSPGNGANQPWKVADGEVVVLGMYAMKIKEDSNATYS